MRDTADLSLVEHGVYTVLLDHYYSTAKPLPSELNSLYRICRTSLTRERRAVKAVADRFFPVLNGTRHNARADLELAIALPAIDKMREAGHRGADKRWHGEPHSPPHRVTDRVAIEPPTSNLQPPIKEESKPLASSDQESLSAIALIPLVGKKEWPVSPKFLAELEAAYPQVDGPATLREIRAWCVSNPSKCKTQRGVMRFINRWFEKVQNA